MYTDMVTLEVMDTIFYEAQRQGRISFYATTTGEEAINIASTAALHNDDFVFPQYREPGVLLWRGFTLQEFAHQCFGNKYDNGKGRQMPIHYGSRKHNYFTIASTVATQIPHAVGAAYSLKMEKQDSCVIIYFGDGGSSTADFHAAMNFAAVLEVPLSQAIQAAERVEKPLIAEMFNDIINKYMKHVIFEFQMTNIKFITSRKRINNHMFLR
ncbi:hypothetical protein L6452_30125 [Arctium lappa]|uniref:Uncharacterized protein n=1 Tax=Arctium lappa TaxID=4217 RepID=A0ACB8ZJ07_ARCLA|nr:hypothetical protein L6452_30125 [Arctium lappa]